jgi:hypothetical protein
MHRIVKIELVSLACVCTQPPVEDPSIPGIPSLPGIPAISRPPLGNPYPNIAAIPLPPGIHRCPAGDDSFCAWLRRIPLKKDRTVYLYNGVPKRNQDVQFATKQLRTWP